MAQLDLERTALLLVDIQKGFYHPSYYGTSRSTPSFEDNVSRLLAAFRGLRDKNDERGPLIIHVYHSSRYPASPLHPDNGDGREFMAFAEPKQGEPVFEKSVNSAFIGTGLEALLRKCDVRQLVLCGLTTDHCVSTTVRMAANLGVTDRVDESTGKRETGLIVLVDDATAAFAKGGWDAETVHDVHVQSLRDEFAVVMTTAELLGLLN